MQWHAAAFRDEELTAELLANLEDFLSKTKRNTLPVDRLFLLALVRRVAELERIKGLPRHLR